MTREAHSDKFTDFSGWLRALGNDDVTLSSRFVSLQNVDYFWHNHRENWLIFIEEKTRGGMRNMGAKFAQDDTHTIIAQMLINHNKSNLTVRNMRGAVIRPQFRGRYRITFENTTPDDGAMWINDVVRTRDDLILLLKTGRLATATIVPLQPATAQELAVRHA